MTDFQVKSAEEVGKMSAEERVAYVDAKNDFDKARFKSLEEGKASQKDFDALKNEIHEQTKQLNAHFTSQLKSMAHANAAKDNSVKPMTVKQAIVSALKVAKEEGKLDEIKTNRRLGFAGLDIKAVGTMSLGTWDPSVNALTGGSISGGVIPLQDRLEGFNVIPQRQVRLLDVMVPRGTQSNVIEWVYQADKEGGAAQTGEGQTKSQADFSIALGTEAVKKSTNFTKVTTEMLDDIEWLAGEIENDLTQNLLRQVEEQAYSGDGTGLNLRGIRTVASAFSAGNFAGTVDNPNIVDVLVVAANQIRVDQENQAAPNAIMMHPNDVTSLKLVKVSSTDRRYVERLTEVGGTLRMDGIPIIETTLVTEGEYLIGDFTKALLVTREAPSIDIGLDGNDFTENTRTILIEWRGAVVVKNNDRSAFVAGDFVTDTASLDANPPTP